MAQGLITDTNLTAIANAIRAKNGSSDTYTPAEMATAIQNLPSGGVDTLVEYLEQRDTLNYALASNTTITEVPFFAVKSTVRDMSNICYNCTRLTTMPLIDTAKVTSFSYAFANCKLATIPAFNTSSVTNMNSAFYGCKEENLPTLDTSSVTNFRAMFAANTNLKTFPQLDLSKGTTFGGSGVYDGMFSYCTKLVTVPVLSLSSATSTTALRNMFNTCSALSNESLNNVLASLLTARVSANKTLQYIGLTSTQATTCTGLSNWAALEAAGWTTGY